MANPDQCQRKRFDGTEVLDLGLLSAVDESDENGDLDSGEEEMLNEGLDPTIDR